MIHKKNTRIDKSAIIYEDPLRTFIRKRAEKKSDKETTKEIPRYYAYLSAVSIMNRRVIFRFLLPYSNY